MYAQDILAANLLPMSSEDKSAQLIWEWGYDGVEVGIRECAPGTPWVTPRHWRSTWTVHQTVRKLYVIDTREFSGVSRWLRRSVHLPVGVGDNDG